MILNNDGLYAISFTESTRDSLPSSFNTGSGKHGVANRSFFKALSGATTSKIQYPGS